MGLAICKSIVEAHNGSISLKPGTHSGALFEVLLPSLKASSPTIDGSQGQPNAF